MSNRFKFRAWNGEGMEYGGFEIHPTAGHIHPHPQLSCLKVDSPLMQFTGLVDKSGVDIYEGDLIKVTPDDGEEFNHEVSYSDEYGGFWIDVKDADYDCTTLQCAIESEYYEYQVVGNIYETPPLMEQQA